MHTHADVHRRVHTVSRAVHNEHTITTHTHKFHGSERSAGGARTVHTLYTVSPHAHTLRVGKSRLVCEHKNIHTGTFEFVSIGLSSASRKINVLLSKTSCRPHKSLLLDSCALPPTTLPHHSSKGEMQRVIIIRQGQITGLG